MNKKLGSLGKAQKFVATGDSQLGENVSLAGLVGKINDGEIDSLLILGDNPAITAPGDVDFAAALGKVENTVYLGEYDDETAVLCEWSLPLAHPLESWGDCVNDDGHYGVCQPQILPLLGGRAAIEVLAVMLGERGDRRWRYCSPDRRRDRGCIVQRSPMATIVARWFREGTDGRCG